MPTLGDYAPLAPFSLDELVEAANSAMRVRHGLSISVRTARYYIAKGLLPSPFGSPKSAKYGPEHLIRACGLKVLQDDGLSLERADERVSRAVDAGIESAVREVQSWLQQPPSHSAVVVSDSLDRVREVREPLQNLPRSMSVVRVPLSENLILEIGEKVNLEIEVSIAVRALEKLRMGL